MKEFRDASGENQFSDILEFARRALILPYSNADVELIFSAMNYVKYKIVNCIKTDLLNAILVITFELIRKRKCCMSYKLLNSVVRAIGTIAVALDMSKAFDTVNIHTLTKKLLDTQIPPILIKFIANYIKGRKAFTKYNNKTSTQRQFKTGVPQGGVLSPTLFNIYTSDIPSPPPNINITVYADDITMTSTDTNKEIAQAKLQPYLQEIASWTQQNQLHLNPDKTTSTLFTPDPAEYSTQLTLNIDNVVIPTVKNPKILGLTFDPKLTYNSHIRKTSDKAINTLKLLKALTSTKWGKQKETIVATYKAITRPILEYASTIWSPIASTTGITKLQTIQNMALRIATGCTSDTNIQHLHNETNILPLNAHLKLHSSQLRLKSQHPTHPLHKFTVLTENERHKKQTIFDNNNNYSQH